MSDLRKAAEAALAAMDYMLNNGEWYQTQDRADALRAALAQPEPWMGVSDNPYASDADCNDPNGRAMSWHNKLQAMQRKPLTESGVNEMYREMFCVPKGKTLTHQNWFQAGVAWAENAHGIGGGHYTPLYTSTPQRKPLTEEALMALLPGAVRLPPGWKDFARAIEKAHGIL